MILSSEVFCRVVWYVVTDVSEELTTSRAGTSLHHATTPPHKTPSLFILVPVRI